MTFVNPPSTNGVMVLTDEEKVEIKGKLEAISSSFIPSIEQPELSTFYVVATYNKDNDFKINGDTYEALMNEGE